MFRKLTRIKQALSLSDCQNILETELRGVLSINNLDDYPYGIPLNHYYDKDNNRLYFHSSKFGYKIESMKKNNKCSYNVIKQIGLSDNNWSYIYHSVIIFGKIHFVNDIEEIERISRLLSYKFTSDNNYIDNEINKSLKDTCMFYIEILDMNGKIVNEK